jgi:hypothetical protein
MDDQTAKATKARLDEDLTQVGPNVGIAFGFGLLGAFKDRGWITMKTFGVLGTSFGATKLPCYGSHYAFPTWDLPENEFKVGGDAKEP